MCDSDKVGMFVIRQLQMSDDATLDQLWNLQQAAYRIEADMIGFDKIPPLLETVDDLRRTSEIFFGWWEGQQLAGAVSIEMIGPVVMDICRLMVRPDYFRRGIGAGLLSHVLHMPDVHTHRIATGVRNIPALTLYEREGFQYVRDEEIAPGVWLRHLERKGEGSYGIARGDTCNESVGN